MTLDLALRITEILLAFAVLLPSAEHLAAKDVREKYLFAVRGVLCVWLFTGFASQFALLALTGWAFLILHRFQGPYNGGSDRMSLLVLLCLTLAENLPGLQAKELAFGYLGFQLTLSYFISGWVKIVNPDWRSGAALRDVFLFSAYPVSENLRGLANRPNLLLAAGWAVIIFELAFPLSLISPITLAPALLIAASFHFSNACFFGLNRFFWAWLSAFPSLIWLQERFIGAPLF